MLGQGINAYICTFSSVFIYLGGRERERGLSPICWFTTQMPKMTRGPKLETQSMWVAETQLLKPLLLSPESALA